MTSTAIQSTYSNLTSCAVGVVASDGSLRDRLLGALALAEVEIGACAPSATRLVDDSASFDLVILYQRGDAAVLIESIGETRTALADTTLVVVWPATDEANARRALRAGADGLVSEADLETTLLATIRAVRSGLTCVPRRLRARLDSESLSMREKQVLGMLVRGCTNAEIASRLFLAESTVKSHLSSAYTKLGVRSRKDAATLILDPGRGLGPGILAISAA